ncbi:MAG TPA: hypothetical protein VIJ15_16060 [Dermatophilaceae bacterium]
MGGVGAFMSVICFIGFMAAMPVALVDDGRNKSIKGDMVVAALFACGCLVGLAMIYIWFQGYTF